MDLMITSLGMVSSVGFDFATSCASIRAGLNRRRELVYYSEIDEETMDTTPIIGSPIHGYTEGFNIVGCWVRIALGCLDNLVEYGMLPDRDDTTFWSKTGLIGVTPFSNDERLGGDDGCTPDDLKEAYIYCLLDVFNHPIPQKNLDIICSGHSGTIAAIKHATVMMAEKKLERIIILAVDSYLDPNSLNWLAENIAFAYSLYI